MYDNAAAVFVYMGEGAVVPEDVVRVRVDPTVLVIPEEAFSHRKKKKRSSFMMVYVKLVSRHSAIAQP